ncbi:dimethylsulfonioproprionate lyase family protein [Aeromicrobium sp. CnD17-E]|uniref:dimethylsulfonioproprionate lyase family protein n=1 Tax=Aeromicrobium sp. CnD17-E TaxID=2954487 RepID=UPI0020974A76|nr:dimethylsulfonioproprionate lyase family protein [Aeromicrobium sp. CnD17-E]MCO7238390.1 dimethylsulfoniopropionate lyase [Aeromicrobium sp. CnD17-E]
MSSPRLRDHPDLLYTIGDFDALYRFGSAGGSRPIRSHMRRVRETIADVFEDNPEVIDREPARLPVVNHLGRALDLGSRGDLSTLSDSIRRISDRLTWEHGYEKVPRGLAKKYGYCEIVGPRGPVVTDRIVLGLVLFAPEAVYPQHHHRGIQESYVAIAGEWSENDGAVHAPGSLILNEAGHEHRITTGRQSPCLLAYSWLGPADRLIDPAMRFSPRRRPTRP